MGWEHGIVWKGAGHWSPWLYLGVPQPPFHTPALGHLLTGLRAQVDSIGKAWLFQELLDQAGKGARKELHFHGGNWEEGQGTQDQGFWIWVSVEDSTPPLYKFGTNIPQKATKYKRIRTQLHCRPLKPFLTSFLSPEVQIQRPLGRCLSHVSFQNLPAGVCPVPHGPLRLLLFTDLILSPTHPCNLFPLTPPLPLSFSLVQPIREGRQVKEGEERRLV